MKKKQRMFDAHGMGAGMQPNNENATMPSKIKQ